jgi:hypothetical protein
MEEILVDQVLNQLVGLTIGLATGLATGFYFERRAGRETRMQNMELRAELEALRSSVYTVGADDGPIEHDSPPSTNASIDDIVKYAKLIQNSQGLVRKSSLIEHFALNGCSPASVNQAIQLAEESGIVSVSGLWVTIR